MNNNYVVDNRLAKLPIHYMRTRRPNADSIIVLMPAALPHDRPDRARKYYTRWNWRNEWRSSEVIAFSDPALQQDERLNGAWYVHPSYDVTGSLCEIVSDVAAEYKIGPEDIIFYGSSLGGFGSLACASNLQGSYALAEVPQTEIQNWIPLAGKHIESYITQTPLPVYRQKHPEQLSTLHRFLTNHYVPNFTIVTNLGDPSYNDQITLMKWCRSTQIDKGKKGQELIITNSLDGHKVFEKEVIVQMLKNLLNK